MDKYPILKCLCRRLYLIGVVIALGTIFILYLKSQNISNVNIQTENPIPTIVVWMRNQISDSSLDSKPSLKLRERQKKHTSLPGWARTSENVSYSNRTTLLPNDTVADFNRTTNDPVIDSSLSSKIVNSPTTLPIPETCRRSNMGGGKLILLWTPFFGTWDYFPQANFQLCPHCRNCQVTTDRSRLGESDAVIFHVRDIELFDLPPVRHPRQRWVFYALESPAYSDFPGLQHMRNMFNWTMTYRMDSDVVSRYGAVVKNRQAKEIDLQSLKRYFSNKSKSVVWMASHCPTFGNRDQYVSELRKYIEVDVYGTCGTFICPPGHTDKCLLEFADKYKFFLAFENSICRDYITEKVFRNLEYDIIPVVFGGADYEKVVPPGSYIDALSFQSPKHLALFLSAVGRDFELYSSYFKWRANYSTGIINRKECDLCTMLHREDIEPYSYNDLRRWWVTDSHCHAWEPKQ